MFGRIAFTLGIWIFQHMIHTWQKFLFNLLTNKLKTYQIRISHHKQKSQNHVMASISAEYKKTHDGDILSYVTLE